MRIDALPGDHPLQVLVVLWIGYFISLVAVVEMMPRTFSRFTGFLGSKVNYIMWWCACLVRVRVGVGVGVRATCCRSVCQCFVKAMWNLCMCTTHGCMSPGYHPLQVLRQGHVEGGARPSRPQEDRLQGDREEGRRQEECGGRRRRTARAIQGLRPERRRGGAIVSSAVP